MCNKFVLPFLCALILDAANSIAITAAPAAQLIITAWYPLGSFGSNSFLYLRGSFSSLTWDQGVQLALVGTDQWSIQLPLNSSELNTTLEYKVLVDDDVWMQGANAQVTVSAPSSTGIYSTTVYPWFGTDGGSYEYVRSIYSPQLGNTRDLVVYLPPSYGENPYKSFSPSDVLFMHDGQNLFNASTSSFGVAWMCQDTVNALVAEGNMREILIIGINNNANRTYELTYSVDQSVGTGGGLDFYLDFIEQTLFPLVEVGYRITGTGRWGILGSSLGGLASCYAGWTRPDVYWLAGCMSSSFWWNNEDFNNTILPQRNAGGAYPPIESIYVDSGNAGPDDDDFNQTVTVRNHLQSLGFPNATYASTSAQALQYYLDNGGQHSEAYWGARFHVPMTYAYPPLVDEALPL